MSPIATYARIGRTPLPPRPLDLMAKEGEENHKATLFPSDWPYGPKVPPGLLPCVGGEDDRAIFAQAPRVKAPSEYLRGVPKGFACGL
jgi:hypothetical protein